MTQAGAGGDKSGLLAFLAVKENGRRASNP
jgi:hypothetical protein